MRRLIGLCTCLGLVFATPSLCLAEVVAWSPRVQVSHTTTDGDSVETLVRGLEFQRDGNSGLHCQLAVDKTGLYTVGNGSWDGNGYSLDVNGSLDWADAWDNAEIYTFCAACSVSISADHHMTIDSENGVHVVYEDFTCSSGTTVQRVPGATRFTW